MNDFVNNNNEFSLKLYREIANTKDGSFIFSPFSIQITGGLLHLGANGTTSDITQNGFDLMPDSNDTSDAFQNILNRYKNDDTLKIANGIFIADDLEIGKRFSSIARRKYNSTITNVAFSDSKNATKQINHFVVRRTNGKIRQLFGPSGIDPQTKMLLINAIYFKGEWKEKFKPLFTQKDTFYSTAKDIIKVDTMYGFKHYKWGINRENKYIIGEFDFVKTDISLQIIIPSKPELNVDHIENLIRTFGLKNITEEAQMREVEGQVQIPKFIDNTEIDLKYILARIGMEDLFSDEADFSKFLKSNQPLSISKAIHKAFFEINEDGAEAAAATGYELEFRMADGNMKSFRANQSFIYLLKGSKGEIYFMGRFNGQ